MKRKQPDWKRAYGPDPDEYGELFERTLSNLKEEHIVNKKFALRTVLIAALVSLLLVGTVLAVGNALGILNFFEREYGVTPTDQAADTISKNLGAAQDGRIRLTVREAVYDGETVRALLAVEPLDAQKYIVTNDIGEIIEVEAGKTAEQCAEEYAQTTGRTILVVPSVWIDMKDSDNYMDAGSTTRDADALLEYCEISMHGQSPETAQIVANAAMLDGSVCEVSFSLEKTPVRVQALTPGNTPDSGVTVLSASLSRTPFADYMHLIYQTAKTPYAQIAQAFAADATYYMTGGGVYAHTDPECSGMANAQAATYPEVIAAKKLPCPVCAGGDMARMAGGEAWAVELLDEAGQTIKAADSGASEAADSEDAYSRLIVIQSGTLPVGNLYVRFTAPDGKVCPAVKLEYAP